MKQKLKPVLIEAIEGGDAGDGENVSATQMQALDNTERRYVRLNGINEGWAYVLEPLATFENSADALTAAERSGPVVFGEDSSLTLTATADLTVTVGTVIGEDADPYALGDEAWAFLKRMRREAD